MVYEIIPTKQGRISSPILYPKQTKLVSLLNWNPRSDTIGLVGIFSNGWLIFRGQKCKVSIPDMDPVGIC